MFRIQICWDHEIEVDGKTFLVGPDIRESLHGITGVAKDDSLQKIEFSLEQAFKRRFNQMAAIRGKMGLHMGHLDGCAHKAQRMAPGCMEKFFRNIRTEKTDSVAVLWEMGSHFLISQRGDRFDLFPYF
jgi:hypothetical protein